MYTLFGSTGSGSSAVGIALAIAGMPFCDGRTLAWEADPALGELCRHNPLGQIPAFAEAPARIESRPAMRPVLVRHRQEACA